MNLKDFLVQRENPPELFWSIIVQEGAVESGIWRIEEETTVVESIGTYCAYLKDELITAVDTTLSSAMQKLAEDSIEPQKTVFGVPSSWVSGGEIKDDHLAKIKKVCDELTLTPVGFVVLPEAIAHLYKSEEGVPVSAIIVGLSSESIELSVFKLGNLVGSTVISRSVSLSDDVFEGLSRFEGAAPLPSRFIVYDGRESELEAAKDDLLKSSWDNEDKVKFLHTPKVETLPPDKKILAVSLAGASEMQNVSKVILKEFTPIGPEIENVEPVTNEESIRDLGFAINEDIGVARDAKKEPAFVVEKKVINSLKLPRLPKLKLPQIPKINFPKAPFLVVSILILLVIGILFYFLPHAKVIILVTPKSFEKSLDMVFDSENSELLAATVSGTKTKETTGRKVVGDKAKGSVEVANGNASAIKLAAGTLLTSSAGLKFVTTEEASISGQILPGSPGTATVNVNAFDIGSQYNLTGGEVFSVGNYAKSLVAATSKGDFSGGSSRDISAVSKEDQEILLKDLKDELTKKAKEDLLTQTPVDKILVSDFSSIVVEDQNFDYKVGDEASTLKLDLEITAKSVAAHKDKLFEFTKTQLAEGAPSGFTLYSNQIDYNFSFINEKDNKFNYKTNVVANYLPSVDIEDIRHDISGKSIDATKNYLDSLPGFRGAQIIFNSKIFKSIKILPLVSKNIDIEIASEK